MNTTSLKAPLEQSTRKRWNARVIDNRTPWSPSDMKHFSRLVAHRLFDPDVCAFLETIRVVGPYKLDGAWCLGKEKWLRARHVRLDGAARLGSPIGDHVAEAINTALLEPEWALLDFFDAGTVLREAIYPLVHLSRRGAFEGVTLVIDGDLKILVARRHTLERKPL